MYCNFMHFHTLIEIIFDSIRLNHNKQVVIYYYRLLLTRAVT